MVLQADSRKLQLMLVDDNDDDVLFVRESFGVQPELAIVSVLTNGEEALHELRNLALQSNYLLPDIILLDINMPRMNGFETLRAIKTDPLIQHIPVVMLTTSSREEDILKCYQYGASSYITKPVTLQSIMSTAWTFSNYWGTIVTLPPHPGA